MADRLTQAQRRILAGYPPVYTDMALAAISRGKAFCPACHWAEQANCAHFDECGSAIFPPEITTPAGRRALQSGGDE